MALSLENCCCCVKFDCCVSLSIYRGGAAGQGRKTQYTLYNSEGLLLFCVSQFDMIRLSFNLQAIFLLFCGQIIRGHTQDSLVSLTTTHLLDTRICYEDSPAKTRFTPPFWRAVITKKEKYIFLSLFLKKKLPTQSAEWILDIILERLYTLLLLPFLFYNI